MLSESVNLVQIVTPVVVSTVALVLVMLGIILFFRIRKKSISFIM